MVTLAVFHNLIFAAQLTTNLVAPSDTSVASTNFGAPADAQSQSADLELPAPVAHWKFDEAKGMQALDSSGNQHTGILQDFARSDAKWVAGRLGGGLEFNTDATNNVVLVPDAASLNFSNHQAFSIAAWVKSDFSQSNYNAAIICKGTGSGGEQYAIDITLGKYRFFVRPASHNPSTLVLAKAFPNGRWQHLAATYDSRGGMAFYINGRKAGSVVTAPATLVCTAHEVSIGSRQSGTNADYNMPFAGIIDDVRIYDCALTSAQASSLYSSAGPLPPGIRFPLKVVDVRVGTSTNFWGLADGMDPLRFQWQKDGTNLLGANSTVLRLNEVRVKDAGNYTLFVTGGNGAVAAAHATLIVRPFFWQTLWFWGLIAAALVVSLAASIRFVERRRTKLALERLERFHAIDRERMRIARDMHDEIGGKLSRISFLSEMAGRDLPEDSPSRKQIDAVSTASRKVIQTLDEIVWAVNPSNDSLESLVHYICRHAEEFFELTGTEIEFELPPKTPACQLSAETRHNFFCAVKEALNNAFKHSGAAKIRILFHADETALQVRIIDNGCGMPAEPAAANGNGQPDSGTRSDRNGIPNIRKRIEHLSGQCTWENRTDGGTAVSLSMPLAGKFGPPPNPGR